MNTDLTPNYPLTFTPLYRSYLWGGNTIPHRYKRASAPIPCAESWEIAAHPDGDSMVANGSLQGHSLSHLTTRFGHSLLGTQAPDPTRFPLLFKIIDAHTDLSLQVHPNENNAPTLNGEPKTETWVILDHKPGASIAAGLKDGTTHQTLHQSLIAGNAESLLLHHRISRYDSILIPGGMVHSIGAGSLVYEVQQSSNTTYRLYDWNRRDSSGKTRELHIDKGLAAIEWSLPPPNLRHHCPEPQAATSTLASLTATPFFNLNRLSLVSAWHQTLDGTSMHVIFVEQGEVEITASDTTIMLAEGSSALIPAATPCYSIFPKGKSASLLLTTL